MFLNLVCEKDEIVQEEFKIFNDTNRPQSIKYDKISKPRLKRFKEF